MQGPRQELQTGYRLRIRQRRKLATRRADSRGQRRGNRPSCFRKTSVTATAIMNIETIHKRVPELGLTDLVELTGAPGLREQTGQLKARALRLLISQSRKPRSKANHRRPRAF